MKLRKRIVVLAAAVALATTILLSLYLRSVERQNIINYNTDTVVVAKEDIPVDTKITPDMVELREIAADSVHPDAAMSVDEVIGYITKSDIMAREQVLLGRIATGQTAPGLSYKIPEGMRAMTISTNETLSLGGFIRVGDKIDILASYGGGETLMTYTQLQNIEVAAVGTSPGTSGQVADEVAAGNIPSSVTLLLTPDQAEILSYAQINGTLNITLRSPIDKARLNILEYGSENFDSWRGR